jgi:hypothetical protein
MQAPPRSEEHWEIAAVIDEQVGQLTREYEIGMT